jgi:hypothetical protein
MNNQICKNCDYTFDGNFCSNCGQKTNTKRLDWNYLKDEAKYTFLHLNNGLLYTSKQLLTRPGDMVKEFIDGKRVKHYKPILLVFVLAGVSTFLAHYNGDLMIMEKLNTPNSKNAFSSKDFSKVFGEYYTLIQLLSVPIISVCTWLAFRKWGYNFIENIIINSFATAQLMIIGILFTPIKFLCANTSFLFISSAIIGFGSYGFNIWLYLKLYKDKDLGHIILRLLLVLFYVALLLIISIIIGVLFVLFIKHPLKT